MRSLFIVAMFTAVTGCVASNAEDVSPLSPQRGDYIVEISTIERHSADSNTIGLYTPGAREIGLYDPATDRVSRVPANADNIGQFLKGIDSSDQGVDTSDESAVDALSFDHTRNESCRSGDGSRVCHCPWFQGCCRGYYHCWCC